MLDGLTNQEAYRIEKQKLEELHKQNRDQLWNTIDESLVGITWQEYKRKRREDIARSNTPSGGFSRAGSSSDRSGIAATPAVSAMQTR
jgi:hypothetical protein